MREYPQMLLEVKLKHEAFVMYLAEVILALEPDTDEQLLRDVRVYAGGGLEKWKDVLFRLLHGRVDGWKVGAVMDVYARALPLLEADAGLLEFQEEFRWFSRAYPYRDVEFKR